MLGVLIVVLCPDRVADLGFGAGERRNEDVVSEARRQLYLGSRKRADVVGRTPIVIDDGIATGATTRAALRCTRMHCPKRLVLAVPIARTDSLPELRQEADDVVCLEDHEMFGAIGFYYRDFRQISDEEVISILQRFPPQSPREFRLPAA